MNTTTLAVIFVCVFAAAIPYMLRTFLWNRFTKVVNNQDYQQALEMLDRRLYKTMFGDLNIAFNQLKVYLSMNDDARIVAQTNQVLSMRLNKSQRGAVCSITYFYFINSENAEMAKKILESIRLVADDTEYNYDAAMYRVIIEKKSEDIGLLKSIIRRQQRSFETRKKC